MKTRITPAVSLLLTITLFATSTLLPLPARADEPAAAPGETGTTEQAIIGPAPIDQAETAAPEAEPSAAEKAAKTKKEKEPKEKPEKGKATPAPAPTGLPGEEMMTQTLEAGDETATPLKPRVADPLKQVADVTGEHTVNEFSGNFEYSYPLPLPEGRNGLTPDVSLTYNSSDRDINSPVGYGWSLNIPKIERFTRGGIDTLYIPYSEFNFTSPFAGGNGELVADSIDSYYGYGSYAPKVVTGQFQHEYLADNSWRVTDGKGTVYRFGTSAAERIQNESGSRVSSWYLTSVTDLNGNGITYEYKKAGNNLYPSRIKWGNSTSPFEVRFEPYFSGTIEVPDWLPSESRGFEVVEKMDLLDRIEVIAPNTSDKIVYEFTYGSAGALYNTISYLQKIQKKGIKSGVETAENPTEFTYASYDGSRSFAVAAPLTITGETMYFGSNLVAINNASRWIYGDYNGDGWDDLVKDISYQGVKYQEAWINHGNGSWTHRVETPDNVYWLRYETNGDIVNGAQSPMIFDLNGNGFSSLCRKDIISRFGWASRGSFTCSQEGISGIGGSAAVDVQFFDFGCGSFVTTGSSGETTAWRGGRGNIRKTGPRLGCET
jgi:hypothetical protein